MRHTIVLVSFMVLCLGTFVVSFVGNWDGGIYSKKDNLSQGSIVQDSHFSKLHYYLNRDGKKSFWMEANELILNNSTKKSVARMLSGQLYTKRGKEVSFSGKKGIYDESLEKLYLEGDVDMVSENTKGKSWAMTYWGKEDFAELFDNVKTSTFYEEEQDYLEVTGDYAKVFTEERQTLMRGNVDGLVRRNKRYEESLYFKSDYLFMNGDLGKINLNGNVRMKKQLLTAESRRGEIFLNNYNKKLKYFVLYDDVKVEEKVLLSGKKPILRKAYSDKLEGMMRESKAVLTGYPKVYQESDIIRGNKIILRENTEVIEVIDANTNILLKE